MVIIAVSYIYLFIIVKCSDIMLTVHFIAFLKILVLLLDFSGSFAVSLDVVVQVPAQVFIRNSEHEGVQIITRFITVDI